MLYDDYLKKITGCPFCDRDNYSLQLIAENKTSALIVSLAPYQKHHLLIIPKRHLEKILELSKEEILSINKLQNIAIKILYKLGYEDMSVLVREGENIGKSVKHLHYYIIPKIMIGSLNIKSEKRSISSSDEISSLIKEILVLMNKF